MCMNRKKKESGERKRLKRRMIQYFFIIFLIHCARSTVKLFHAFAYNDDALVLMYYFSHNKQRVKYTTTIKRHKHKNHNFLYELAFKDEKKII